MVIVPILVGAARSVLSVVSHKGLFAASCASASMSRASIPRVTVDGRELSIHRRRSRGAQPA